MNKEFYKLKSELIKALANPTRLMIIDALIEGEKNVSELVKICDESQSSISKSLSILKANGILEDSKRGLNVYYSLKICCMDKFFTSINAILKEKLESQKRLLQSY